MYASFGGGAGVASRKDSNTMIVFETERLRLRRLRDGDLDALYARIDRGRLGLSR